MSIDGTTRLIGIIGDPIAQVKAPASAQPDAGRARAQHRAGAVSRRPGRSRRLRRGRAGRAELRRPGGHRAPQGGHPAARRSTVAPGPAGGGRQPGPPRARRRLRRRDHRRPGVPRGRAGGRLRAEGPDRARRGERRRRVRDRQRADRDGRRPGSWSPTSPPARPRRWPPASARWPGRPIRAATISWSTPRRWACAPTIRCPSTRARCRRSSSWATSSRCPRCRRSCARRSARGCRYSTGPRMVAAQAELIADFLTAHIR